MFLQFKKNSVLFFIEEKIFSIVLKLCIKLINNDKSIVFRNVASGSHGDSL